MEDVSYAQYEQIRDVNRQTDYPWIISVNKNDMLLEFSTDMDNFNMYEFLVSIGVDKSQIRWD